MGSGSGSGSDEQVTGSSSSSSNSSGSGNSGNGSRRETNIGTGSDSGNSTGSDGIFNNMINNRTSTTSIGASTMDPADLQQETHQGVSTLASISTTTSSTMSAALNRTTSWVMGGLAMAGSN